MDHNIWITIVTDYSESTFYHFKWKVQTLSSGFFNPPFLYIISIDIHVLSYNVIIFCFQLSFEEFKTIINIYSDINHFCCSPSIPDAPSYFSSPSSENVFTLLPLSMKNIFLDIEPKLLSCLPPPAVSWHFKNVIPLPSVQDFWGKFAIILFSGFFFSYCILQI